MTSKTDEVMCNTGEETDEEFQDRDCILRAALLEFAARRHEKATIAGMARRARIDRPSVSEARILELYPGGKDELHQQVKARLFLMLAIPRICRPFRESLSCHWETRPDGVEECISTYFAACIHAVTGREIEFVKAFQEAMIRPQTFQGTLIRTAGEYGLFEKLAEGLQARGQLRTDVPIDTLLSMVVSIVVGTVLKRILLLPNEPVDETELALLAKVVSEGVRPRLPELGLSSDAMVMLGELADAHMLEAAVRSGHAALAKAKTGKPTKKKPSATRAVRNVKAKRTARAKSKNGVRAR